MSRNAEYQYFRSTAPAASATTVTSYHTNEDRPFAMKGFVWTYQTAEANTDNTLDFVIDYATDGSNFTTLFSNGNPNGLLDTAAPLIPQVNMGNAASSGTTALTVASLFPGSDASLVAAMRIPAGALLRVRITTAGTGTVPAVNLDVFGVYV